MLCEKFHIVACSRAFLRYSVPELGRVIYTYAAYFSREFTGIFEGGADLCGRPAADLIAVDGSDHSDQGAMARAPSLMATLIDIRDSNRYLQRSR
jgi:hypothetical protein